MRKWNVSVSTSQITPNAADSGNDSKSRLTKEDAHSHGGIDANISRLLLAHLVRWKPPFANSARN